MNKKYLLDIFYLLDISNNAELCQRLCINYLSNLNNITPEVENEEMTVENWLTLKKSPFQSYFSRHN